MRLSNKALDADTRTALWVVGRCALALALVLKLAFAAAAAGVWLHAAMPAYAHIPTAGLAAGAVAWLAVFLFRTGVFADNDRLLARAMLPACLTGLVHGAGAALYAALMTLFWSGLTALFGGTETAAVPVFLLANAAALVIIAIVLLIRFMPEP